MSVSYKGLLIFFGGDTTELKAELINIQTGAKKTQSDLKEIDRALKFNPGNTELLGQKVKNLNAAYAETRERLDTYRNALEQLDEKKRSGAQLTEEEERQYDSLQRAIIDCESQLDSYGEKIKSTNTEYEASQTKLYQFGQSLQDNADKWAEHGQKVETAGKAITAASTGIATAAVGAFNEVDEGADAVIRQTGATGDAAEALEASFENVAKQSSADFEEIGNAVGDVNTRFGLTGDTLEQTSLQFLRFAENTGVDVNSAIENTSMSMKAFGVDSSEAGNVLGMFQTVAQNTGIDVSTLMNDVNANGATFRDMGLNIQDSTALLGSFEAAGIPADQMLTGLKKASANCAKEGTNLGDSLRDLTARLQDPATQAQATQDALDLFGTKAGMAFVDAAESGRVNLDSLGGSLDDYANKVDETFEGTEDAPDKMKESLHSLQIAGSELGADILDALVPAVSKAADVADRLKEVWDGLSPEQQKLAADVVLGGIAFGGLTTGVGKAMQSFDKIGQTFKDVAKVGVDLKDKVGGIKSAFSGIWSVISANPWIILAAAIAALVAALVYFFTQTEDGKRIWGEFTQFLQSAWQGVQDFFSGVPAFWQGVWDGITTGAQGLVDGVGQKWDALKQGASDAWESVKSKASDAWDGIKTTVTDKANALKEGASNAWETLKSGTSSAFGDIGRSIKSDMDAGRQAGSDAAQALQAAMSGDWDTARSKAGDAFRTIKDHIQDNMNASKAKAIDIANAIGEKLGFPGLGSKVAGVFSSVKNGITSPIRDAWNYVSGIPGRIRDAFSNLRISIPKPKLPHISVSWSKFGVGDLSVSVPNFGVSWYAKGGIFPRGRRPRIIGVNEGSSAEAVLPIDRLSDLMADAIDKLGGLKGTAISIGVTVNAQVSDKLDAYETGQQIGAGIATKLKQRGVPVAT